jgi:hypothetical protein
MTSEIITASFGIGAGLLIIIFRKPLAAKHTGSKQDMGDFQLSERETRFSEVIVNQTPLRALGWRKLPAGRSLGGVVLHACDSVEEGDDQLGVQKG